MSQFVPGTEADGRTSDAGTRLRVAAVVVAAGQGLRAGQPLPKQFVAWRGKPVIRHSVEALAEAGCRPIVVVIPEGAGPLAREALAGIPGLTLTKDTVKQFQADFQKKLAGD